MNIEIYIRKTTAPSTTATMTPTGPLELLAAPLNCEGIGEDPAVVVVNFTAGRPVPVPRALACVVRLLTG
jgi:hypothetical protein